MDGCLLRYSQMKQKSIVRKTINSVPREKIRTHLHVFFAASSYIISMFPVPALRLGLRVRRSPNGISSYPDTTAQHITKFVTAAAVQLGGATSGHQSDLRKAAYRFESSLLSTVKEFTNRSRNFYELTCSSACINLLAASWPHAIPRLPGPPPFISTPFDILSGRGG
jgi:hypothetical protein